MSRIRRRVPSLVAGLALSAGSMAICLVVLELAVRILVPAPVTDAHEYRFFAYHERLGWDQVAGVEERITADEFDVTVRINAQGIRSDRLYAPTPAPGQRRIVVVGDSFSFGYGVEGHEGFVAQLESRLPQTDVINLSVTGYGTDQQLLKLIDQGLAYQPDLVLLGLFEGDVFRNAQTVQVGYPKPRFVVDQAGRLELINVPVPQGPGVLAPTGLAAWSALWRMAAPRGRALIEHLGYGPAWPVTEAITRRLAEVSTAAGAALVVVVIPKDQAVYGRGVRRKLHERTLRHIDAMLARAGVEAIDLTPAFVAAADEQPEQRLYFEHDGHWNVAGHTLAADVLAAQLAPRLPTKAVAP